VYKRQASPRMACSSGAISTSDHSTPRRRVSSCRWRTSASRPRTRQLRAAIRPRWATASPRQSSKRARPTAHSRTRAML